MKKSTPPWNADVKKVLQAIGDPYGLALREQSEEIETTAGSNYARRRATRTGRTWFVGSTA